MATTRPLFHLRSTGEPLTTGGTAEYKNQGGTSQSQPLALAILVGLYSLSYSLLLLNHGVFWDDWIWMHLDRGSQLQMGEQIGYSLLGPLDRVLLHMGVETCRWIVFLSYLAASVALFKTLCHLPKLDNQKRLYLALLFAVFPVNSARIALSDIHYAIAYGVFFVGLLLFSEFTDRGGVWLRLSSLLLIGLASYVVNSLLFFCILVPALFLYVRSGYSSVHAAVSRLKQIPDFILLPPVVYALKQLYKPFGLYAHYNEVTFHSVAHTPLAIGSAFYRSFLLVIAHAVRVSLTAWPALAAIILLVLCIGWILRSSLAAGAHSSRELVVTPGTPDVKTCLFNLLFGALIFTLGVMPYDLVSKYPSLPDWNSRHQLLIPLGAAWMLVYGLDLLFARWRAGVVYVLAALIAMFILNNIDNLAQFQKDTYKQNSLLRHFASDPAIRQGTSFFVDDQAYSLDANQRKYRFYEYAGMFDEVFGEQRRFAIGLNDAGSLTEVTGLLSTCSSCYLLGQFKVLQPDRVIHISPGLYHLDAAHLVRLMIDERTNAPRYEQEIWNVVRVQVAAYPAAAPLSGTSSLPE
jgi:hypothetical protein